jgi:hypothetical protein
VPTIEHNPLRLRPLTAAIAALLAFAVAGFTAGDAVGESSGGFGPGSSSGGSTTSTGSTSSGPTAEKFNRLWVESITSREKRWAQSTADCESGGDPDAVGGGGQYRGAFQFTKPTWRRSPKSPGGDPVAYPYRTQAVVAVLLMRRDGTEHWPTCG